MKDSDNSLSLKRKKLIILCVTVGLVLLLMVGCAEFWEDEPVHQEGNSDTREIIQVSNTQEIRCGVHEIYDSQTEECVAAPTCDNMEDCLIIGDQLVEQINELFGDLLNDYNSDHAHHEDGHEDIDIVIYDWDGENLYYRDVPDVEDRLIDYQEDTDTHMYLWDMFRYLIPDYQLEDVSGYVVFTDGPAVMLAYIAPDEHLDSWLLGIDIMDADNRMELKVTLLHEFAHIMTLREGQLRMIEDVVYAEEDDPIHLEEKEACSTFFVTGYGCTEQGSYLDNFYLAFWAGDLIEEWEDRGVEMNEDEQWEFFLDHEEKFVTDYAASKPYEDIAETWTYFILFPKPEGGVEWEDKILFFYDYPEQVELRVEVLSRLLSYLTRYLD